MARLLYFATLVDQLGRAAEELDLPGGVSDVASLLAFLRSRGDVREQRLADQAVRVTVNKQFATLGTPVDNRAEIAFIPVRR